MLEVVNDCFARHGSVAMCSLDIGYAGAEDSKGAVQLLAPSGGACTRLRVLTSAVQPRSPGSKGGGFRPVGEGSPGSKGGCPV